MTHCPHPDGVVAVVQEVIAGVGMTKDCQAVPV